MTDMMITDIHCHIIPGVDDGSRSMDRSVGLVNAAYEEGIRRMIATPHFGVRNPEYDREEAIYSFAELKSQIAHIHPDMELYMGNEIFMSPGYPSGLRDGMSKSLAGSQYALIEFPYESPYEEIYRACRDILMQGYVPVIAHIERYAALFNKFKLIEELIGNGVFVQINSDSIGDAVLGRFGGSASARFCQKLLKSGWVDFVATDCHDLPGRQPVMKDAVDVMNRLIGAEATYRILVTNPDCVINNEYIERY